MALLGWFCGCATIWSALFTVGNYLYGRMGYALLCGAVFVGAGSVLIAVIRRLWQAAGYHGPVAPAGGVTRPSETGGIAG